MTFEAVIGLEVHVQLATESKIFCACRARLPEGQSVADEKPNVNTCPVCTAQPGALPVLNRRAVEYALRAGLALGCEIRAESRFARKNYFYPDLPKGYQISQYELPVCEHGKLEIPGKSVRIRRIHMEEDAGKNVHLSGYSLVNLNRAGVPLVEIVTEPDLASSQEAGAYLRALYAIVTYLGICDGNLQEGNFRCDANVSVRPVGETKLGTRAEVKNVNSFKFVEKAIEYEIARQIEVLKSGGRVVQETRGFDANKGVTFSQRSKEEAEDYRYFPDPDLIPLKIAASQIERVRETLPELPEARRRRYVEQLGMAAELAGGITASKELSDFFDRCAPTRDSAARLANVIVGEVARLVNDSGTPVARSRLTPEILARASAEQASGAIAYAGLRRVVEVAWSSGDSADAIIEREGLRQVSDLSALEPAIEKVLADNPKQVEEFKAGKDKLLGFFVGQVMKATGGKANPALLGELVRKKLK